jgi:NADPH-dependent 2,4-dienoyl-CoA reductase/sulfur reductase-like enzyme
MTKYDVVVAGAGPAGLAAACRAAQSGARTAMVDDNPRPGGQIWRASQGTPPASAARWIRLAETHKVEVLAGAHIFGAPGAPGERRLALETLDSDLEIEYGSLVLATGARERFLPFPGWTLPNVMGAGGLQALVKSGMPIQGKTVIVAGSGPLLLAVAHYMRTHGARVRLIAEQTSSAALNRFAMGLIAKPGKLFQAGQLRASLLGVPYRTSTWPIRAEGHDKLECVTLSTRGRLFTEPCDYLACGFGLVPNVELAILMGCRPGNTGVAVDDRQQTTVPGVYAAGEITGIGGLDLSLVEGEIAGYAAAGKPELARRLHGKRQAERRFAAALDRAFTLRPELKQLPQDDTFVCRCEDVTYGRVRQFRGWREAKLQTRCGMGPCQGRICGGAVEFLLGWKAESVRPPVLPVRIGSLTGKDS